MPQGLDMSLGHLRVNNKKARGYHGHFSGGDGSYGPCPGRRIMNRNTVRMAPYCTQLKMQEARSMAEQEVEVSEGTDTAEGTKLYISNLHYDVSNSDIELLFSDIGHVKHHTVHYDRSGRSKGTAEVIYVHYSDAVTAIEKYNNSNLDGKPLKIELVGVKPVTCVPVSVRPPIASRLQGKPHCFFQSVQGRGGGRGLFRGRGTGGIGFAGGRGQVKLPSEKVMKPPPRRKVTAEDLDADLEKYRLGATLKR